MIPFVVGLAALVAFSLPLWRRSYWMTSRVLWFGTGCYLVGLHAGRGEWLNLAVVVLLSLLGVPTVMRELTEAEKARR